MFNVVFCPVRHKLAAQVIKDKEGIKIMQNGRVLINAGSINNISIVCPAGHGVKVKI